MPTADQIAYQLAKLAPPGSLAAALASTLRKLWSAGADELVRIYGRVDALLRESHPSTTDELLAEWEAEYALPDPCVTATQSEAERRAAVISRHSGVGGATPQYFRDLAARFGVTITIVEDHPFEVGRDGMGDGIGGDEWAFVWEVTAPASTSTANRELIECVFERLMPAHVEVIFHYV
jgi:uncharacterized protein YmfQ (DUF2313 family)